MQTGRWFITLFIPLSLVVQFSATKPAVADIYALIIGIDDYAHINDLEGAVNDAEDIAAAVSSHLSPTDVVLLRNAEATRDRILSTWQSFQNRAKPGDTILVTYAGHGGSEPAAYPATEIDGRDETFLLSGFHPSTAASGERIRDDEIENMISRRPDLTHIVVADSCHSGTTTRSSQFDLNYRFFRHGELVDDPLPPPPPPASLGPQSNAIVFGAVSDSEKVPEIGIEGKIRGALSYAFADGIRGNADRDADGLITKGELEVHVRRFVKSALDGRQNPQVSPVGQSRMPLFAQNVVTPEQPKAFSEPFDALPPLPLVLLQPTPFGITGEDFNGITVVSGQAHQGIIVDFNRREIRSSSGDVLRRLTLEIGYDWQRQIQTTIDKMRAVRALERSARSGSLEVFLPLGEQVYSINSPIELRISGRSTAYVTVLNFSSDGFVNYIYPLTGPHMDPEGRFREPAKLAPSLPIVFRSLITPPLGAEHVIVIETPDDLDEEFEIQKLHGFVRRASFRNNGKTQIRTLWNELHHILNDQDYDVGMHAFFTGDTN